MTDRRVHATNADWEVVRYDRAGKWYMEWCGDPDDYRVGVRHRCTVDEAVSAAVRLQMVLHLDLPGGRTFDAKVRAHRSRVEAP